MRKILPYPLVGAVLLGLWLLLNQTLSLGQALLGCVLALAGGWVLAALQPTKTRVRRPGAILRLSSLVLADIARSNIAVGRIVLGLGRPQRRPGFVNIPLDLRNPYAVAMLAGIITATPGTLWVGFDGAVLTIHVLDLIDEGEWVRTIKSRYERRLLEIFE